MPTSSGGSSSGGGGAVALLSTTTLAVDGTFDVSGIAGTYNDLILVANVRGTRASFSDELALRFNNDSGASQYFRQQISGLSTTASAAATGAATAITTSGGALTAASSPSGAFAVWEATIQGYASTSWTKSVLWRGFSYDDPGAGSQLTVHGGGQWLSTTAITRVQIFGLTTANLLTGSQLRIYGRL